LGGSGLLSLKVLGGDGVTKLTGNIGTLDSLKNAKKDINEMRKGGECGMGFEDWDNFQVGDQVQCYEENVERRFL
jgi:translation initiation factor IF-2